MISQLFSFISHIGVDPNDDDETRSWKNTFSVGLSLALLVLFPTGIMYMIFNEMTAGFVYIVFCILCIMLLVVVGRFPQYYRFGLNVLSVVALVAHQSLSLTLGGFVNSGGVVLWGYSFPVMMMLLVYGPRRAIFWFVVTSANVCLGVFMQIRATTHLPSQLVQLVLTVNLTAALGFLLFPMAFFFAQRNLAFRLLRGEQEKSENLLLNILPKDIAAILKNENRVIADHFDGASILFADVVNFTPMSAKMTPIELVNLLNEVFSHFDTLVEKHGLEKIKTIGDCYMVASGVPRPRADHAQVITQMALEMQSYVGSREFMGRKLSFRIGINSGAVVAGVIGRKKFIYDLWGDAVNTASRMESHGSSGVIQVTQATHDLIKDYFVCEPRGTVNVKGKGDMEVWSVAGAK